MKINTASMEDNLFKMNDIEQFKRAIESQHGGTATFVKTKTVTETWQGKTVWNGAVHVFDFAGDEQAKRAYAWSEPVDGSDNRSFYAVLHAPSVDSAKAAVRASIVHRNRK